MVEAVGALSARPPTPPRTGIRMLSEKDRTHDSPIVVQTPGDSPFTVNGSTGAPSTRQSKRVNFSPWTKYIKPPSFANATLKSKSELKALPPSNECKPAKSILKTTNAHTPTNTTDPEEYTPESFAMLLDSISQQLAGESITSRLDAYMQLFGALRAYEKLPGDQEIGDKLGLMVQFIQRDLSTGLENGGPLGTNLVIQALKLAAALAWNFQLAPQFSDDFKIFLVEHSINCLQTAKAPKSVLTHYMSILSMQNFQPRVMTNGRIARLLTVLEDITTRVNGNAIVSQRLSIYQRLLTQSKSVFISQSALWVEHLLSGLLHHVRDTRLKAISLGFQTTMICGPNPTLSKSVRDLFDRPLDNGGKLVTEICERMARMMPNLESGVHVPQIWSIIVLLLRTKRSTIDQWDHFKEWVLVLQRCFNCSESSIKAQAILGWNRFVAVVSPSDTTSRSMLKMLSKPIMSQFERKKQEKFGSQPSHLAMCSYHNLLYYAFRPSATFHHLDVVWEEYIAAPSSTFASNASLNDRFCQALSNLLWSSQAKIWTENKINESTKLEPEELSSIDCRWVRSRISTVLGVFERVLKSSVWSDNPAESNIAGAWISLSRALSYASSKEITPSPESMQAVGSVLGLLQRLWNAGPSSLNVTIHDAMDAFFERFQFLSTTMIFSLGGISFTEKLLLKTADETFQAANTPTSHPSRGSTNLDSPILHLLRLISDVSQISEPTSSYSRLISGTLEAACDGKASRGSRLELLQQCARLYPSDTEFDLGVRNFAQTVWSSTAQLAAESLRSYPLESARERDGSVIRDYENVVKVLSVGLRFPLFFPAWNQLLEALVRAMRTEKGERAIARMALEPLAEYMLPLDPQSTYLPLSSLFAQSLSIPYCHEESGEGPENEMNSKPSDNEVFFPSHLARLVNRTLQESYAKFNPLETRGVADFLESLTSFLGSGVLSFRWGILESLQETLSLWLKDEARKVNVENGVESRILTACRALSSAVINILQASSPHSALCLCKFESIITAGLESSHASIAKRFFEFLKSTSGAQESLASFEGISRALAKLESHLSSQLQAATRTHSLQGGGLANTALATQEPGDLADMSIKSRISYILDDNFQSTRSPSFNSSPVTNVHKATGLPVARGREAIKRPSAQPAKDNLLHSPNEVRSIPFATGDIVSGHPDDVFAIIDNIRPSSPQAQTPRELGFLTPPHARKLCSPDSGVNSPQTPTLPVAVAEIEDGFFGSSPTPGTRGRVPAGGSTNPSSLATEVMDSHMDIDPPSSPPGMRLLSPSSRNKSELSISHQRPLNIGMGNGDTGDQENIPNPAGEDKEVYSEPAPQVIQTANPTTNEPEQSEKPLKRRLRSSMSKIPISETHTNTEETADAQQQEADNEPRTPTNLTERVDVTESVLENRPDVTNDTANHDEFSTEMDCIADSFSDDMEIQIASQLEQDMESAEHMNEKPRSEPTPEPPSKQSMTRKRKREVDEAEAETPSTQERRRSQRLSSVKAPSVSAMQEAMSTRATRSMTSASSQHVKSSPAPSVAKKRKRQSKTELEQLVDFGSQILGSVPALEQVTSSNDAPKEPGPTEISPQKRRSSRLGGHAAPVMAEESLSRRQSPRTTRSHKPSPTKKAAVSENSFVRYTEPTTESTPEEPEVQVSDKTEIQTQGANQESPVLENHVPETAAAQASLPTVGEDSTNLHMDDAGPSTEQASTSDHAQLDEVPTGADELAQTSDTQPMTTQSTQTDNPTETITQDGVISTLRKALHDIKMTTLDLTSLKEIDDLLFDIRVETHEALRRHTT
ncbi:putative telomere length regulator protein (Rif1) [Aspergillus clavatus NRRL 1]|uniref:Telomere-associated protein Rif1 N-terminal domain-containing protein n=1 Tax=Aspergillus clavatus (strain ATCC 1007 / CBS 513.65 / DSM 816 / NCTC 3887 / NRRL 1 / QM 1276 / 107) TaxID=344612 RepID=A1CHJ8_ASPCL|nr:uncharacterized protein ACLA_048220 [Aspergillus clavatus NRRL 1]EAW10353.1 hypothetical protein ACLA_048220 [Aspergillus clavatus NRRL 1]